MIPLSLPLLTDREEYGHGMPARMARMTLVEESSLLNHINLAFRKTAKLVFPVFVRDVFGV